MKLYICGNGFDMHHKLPTGYGDYKKFLEEHYSNLLEEYKQFTYLAEPSSETLWVDVEADLCIDYYDFFNELVEENYPDFNDESDSRLYNIEIDVDNLTRFINDFTGRRFFEWLSYAEQQDAKADLILDKDALFINFNYTNTIQRLYGVNKDSILHIHGALKNLNGSDVLWSDVLPDISSNAVEQSFEPIVEGDKFSNDYIRSEIQFGATGITPGQVMKELSSKYQNDDFYDVSIKPALNKFIDFVKKSTKNTFKNHDNLIKFIEGKNIEEVVVMGVSLGEADDSYYSDILVPSLKKAKWTFMSHSDQDKKRIENFVVRHHLENTSIIDW